MLLFVCGYGFVGEVCCCSCVGVGLFWKCAVVRVWAWVCKGSLLVVSV